MAEMMNQNSNPQEIYPDRKGLDAPQGLKGIGATNRQQTKQELQEEELLRQRLADPTTSRRLGWASLGTRETVVRPDKVNLQGTSKFDKKLGDVFTGASLGKDYNDLRGEQQTTAGKWINSLINNIAIAGSTAVLGTLGLVDGIIESIATGENKMGDNTMSRAQNDFLQWMDENVPVYRGQEYENKSLFSKLGTAVFWGDFVKNLGYTEGMLIPGMGASNLASKASRLFGAGNKATSWVSKLTGSLVGAMTEASTEAVSNTEDQKKYKLNLLQDKYDEDMRNAEGNQEEMYRLYKEKEKALQAIDEDATKTSNFIFWSNTGLLMATNLIEFGSLFGKSYDSGRRVLTNKVKANIANPTTGKAIKATKDNLTKENIKDLVFKGMSKGKEISRVTAKKLIDSASEGFEEFSQGVISNRPTLSTDYNKFNESILNPEKKEVVDGYMEGWFKSLTNYLEDPNMGVETLMGFLTGFLGAPTYVRGRGITWGNGVITEIHNAAEQGRISKKVAGELNDMVQHITSDEKFLARYKGLIRSLALEDEKSNALERGDKVEYKNAESAQFISDVETFRKAGQVDMFKKIFETMSNMSDEEIAGIITTTTDESGNGPFSKNGKADDIQTVKKVLKERSDRYLNNIDRIVDDAEALEAKLSLHANRLSDDEFNTLLYLKEQGYNFNERMVSMVQEVASLIKYGAYDQILEGADAYIKTYDDTVKEWNEKGEKARELNEAGIDSGIYSKFNVDNIVKLLEGEKTALSLEETKLLEAVVLGKYTAYTAHPDASGRYAVVHPEDFDMLTNMFSKTKQSFAKNITDIIEHFKNSSTNDIIKDIKNNVVSFVWLKSNLNEKALNDETTESLNTIQETLQDLARVSTASNYYNKEFNTLFEKYSKEASKRNLGARVKEKAQEVVEKVTNKQKADKVREEKAAKGEDTSGKSDEEILQEEATQKANVENKNSELGVIKSAILDAAEGLDNNDKKLLSDAIENLISDTLTASGYNNASDSEKANILNNVINELLNHDNYSTLMTGLTADKANKVKDAVRGLKEARKVATKREPIVPQPNAPQQPAPPGQEKEKSAEKPPKAPLDYLTNAFPELAPQLKGTQYETAPVNQVPEKVLKQYGITDNYVKVVIALKGFGAYDAISNLLPILYEKATSSKKPVAVKFLMLNVDTHLYKEKPRIYHAVDVTDSDWAKQHSTQLVTVNGRQYQIIGVHRENEKNPSGWLQELGEKIRKEAEDVSKWDIDKYVSSFETHLTRMVNGKSNFGKRKNVGVVLSENKMTAEDMVLGLVDPKDSVTPMVYATNDGVIHRAGIGESTAKSGAFMVLPSANPNISRYVQMYIPFLNDYLRNNPDTAFTNKLIDAFTGITKFAKENVGETKNDKINDYLKQIYPLIFFGNVLNEEGQKSDKSVKLGVQSFDNGDVITVKIALFRGENAKEESEIKLKKDAIDAEIREAVKEYILNGFIRTIESDTLAATSEKGTKYPLVRIKISYPDHFASDAEALGLSGTNKIVAYKKYLVDNNLLQTDLGSTAEVGAGYTLEKYDPATDKFVQGNDAYQKPTTESSVPQGTPTFVEPKTRTAGILSYASGKQGRLPLTITLDGDNLILTNRDGVIVTNMFPKSYRDKVKTAMQTGSPLPDAPEMFVYKDANNTYTAYYDENGELNVMDRNNNNEFIHRKQNPKLHEDIQKFINDIKSPKNEPVKAEEKSDPLGNLQRLKNKTTVNKPQTAAPQIITGEVSQTTKMLLNKNFVEPFSNLLKQGMSIEDAKQDLLDTFKKYPETKDFGEAHMNYVLVMAAARYLGSQRTISERELNEAVTKFGIPTSQMSELNKYLDRAAIKVERGKRYNASERRMNVQRELKWLERVLPAAAKTLQKEKGFVRLMSDPRGLYVGKFMNGVIYLSENYATKDTVYHEAFHFVFNALIDQTERNLLINKVRETLGNNATVVECEEWLADNFADYVANRETFISRIANSIKNFFRRLFGFTDAAYNSKDAIKNMYDRIQGGYYSNTSILNNTRNIERGKKEINYSKELQNIKAKSIADGTFMKAPNGKPTNLTEKQWLQVRTKAFKEWFGDWETIAEYDGVKILPLEYEATGDDSHPYMPKPGYPIKYNGKVVGVIPFNENGEIKVYDGETITEISPEFRNKKIGKRAYIAAAAYLAKQGKTLTSDTLLTDDAVRLWESLVKDGYAEKVSDSGNKDKYGYNEKQYRFKNDSVKDIDIHPNASKVVDKNDEPLMVYHNSRKKFSEFKQQPYPAKEGFYFSVNPNTASTYGEVSYPVFLNIRNLAVLDARGESWKTFGYTLGIEKAKKGGYYNENMPKNYYGYEEPSDFVKYTLGEEYTGFVINDYKDNYSPKFEDMSGTTYGVFSSNQIKSATDNSGAFSIEDNNIYDSPIDTGKSASKYDIDASIQATIGTLRSKYSFFEATPNKVHKYIMVFDSDAKRNAMMLELKNSDAFKNLPIAFDPLTPARLAGETGTAVDGSKHGLGVRYSYAQMKNIENLNEKLNPLSNMEDYLIEEEEPQYISTMEEQRRRELIDIARDLDTDGELRDVINDMSIDELETFIHCR